MSGTDTAQMVPSKYDVVIDGHGFVFWNGLMQSLPFRNQRAAYSYGKTFIERSNVGGDYGDDQQAFYLTAAQRDWSRGESRLHFDPTTPDGSRMFYSSSGIDPTVEGQITLSGFAAISNPDVSAFVAGITGTTIDSYSCKADSHLYTLGAGDKGAHGLGTASMTIYGMCQDTTGVFMASTSASTVGVRRYDIAATTFSTFSATPSDSIAFNGNVLYGAVNSTAVLQQYSTGGTASTIFPWKDSAGNARKQTFLRLLPFGGDLLILIQPNQDRGELWLYDGTSTYIIARFPRGFFPYDVIENAGVVFISGEYHTTTYAPVNAYVPALFTYLNGSLDELWRPPGPIDIVGQAGTGISTSSSPPAMIAWRNTVVFTTATSWMRYDIDSGAIYSLGSGFTIGASPVLLSTETIIIQYAAGSAARTSFIPPRAGASGSVTSSQFDFGSSLTKTVQGVRVFWTGPAGTSVDISYALDGASSFTSLQVGAVSGTEYTIGLTARVVQYKLTLNGSGSANFDAPIVTRVYLRAVPLLPPKRRCQYVIDLTGVNDRGMLNDPVVLRDETLSTLTGAQMAANLTAAITSSTPISITDRLGTYTGVFEQGEGVTEIDEVRPGEFIAQVTTREV